jgi:SAM-dependent methyltransferase
MAVKAVRPDPRALDAGGGTGNAASLLLELGVNPLVVDISPEMLEIWRRKSAALGRRARTEAAELEEYLLRSNGENWDLIVFSSVLHHLEDPTRVLELASRRLAPGGAILTLFDPTPATRGLRLLRKVDWAIWALLHYPRRALALLGARILRAAGDKSPELRIGRRAERHAYQGIDDRQLAASMSANGLEVLNHTRTCDARYGIVRLALRLASLPSTFSLLMRKPPQ